MQDRIYGEGGNGVRCQLGALADANVPRWVSPLGAVLILDLGSIWHEMNGCRGEVSFVQRSW